ncbi:MAG TPA: hypothetical protein VIJ23_00640 [Mycobacterium sp.]
MGDDERAARRAFIRGHHPDRGGDPQAFITGLQRLTPPPATRVPPGMEPVLAYRTWRFRPARRLRWLSGTRRNLR